MVIAMLKRLLAKVKQRGIQKVEATILLLLIALGITSVTLGYFLVLYVRFYVRPLEITQKILDEELTLRKQELLIRGIAVIELDLPDPSWVEMADFKTFLKGLIKHRYEIVYLTYREAGGLRYPLLWVYVARRIPVGYSCLGNLTRTVLD